MQQELVDAVYSYTQSLSSSDTFPTAVPGLTLFRSDHEKQPRHVVFKPALCVVVQGAKWAIFENRRLEYRAGQALLVSVETPAQGTVSEASRSKPYLGVVIEFDLSLLREVADSLDTLPGSSAEPPRSLLVTDFDGPLADCALRLVRLLGTPAAIAFLSRAIMREICFWLLTGPHGREVMSMTLAKSHTRFVLDAIHSLRTRFAEPVRIEDLASAARLSPSAFHRQFKSITSMTPLQYQKHLRLQEARRLMLTDEATVEAAACRVGYESASQFSREYARLFGLPPRRDVTALKGTL